MRRLPRALYYTQRSGPIRVGPLIEDAYPWRDPREAIRFAMAMFAKLASAVPAQAEEGVQATLAVLQEFTDGPVIPWRRDAGKRAIRRQASKAWWGHYTSLTQYDSAPAGILKEAIEIVSRSCHRCLTLADRRSVATNVWKIVERARQGGIPEDALTAALFMARLRDAAHGHQVDANMQLAFEGVWMAGEYAAAYRLFFKRVFQA
jgi:hypothetical protein